MRRSFFFALAAALGKIFSPVAVRACAVCLAGTGVDDPLSDALNWSVLFLMAMPYAVVGSIAGLLFFYHRRAARSSISGAKGVVLHLTEAHKEIGK